MYRGAWLLALILAVGLAAVASADPPCVTLATSYSPTSYAPTVVYQVKEVSVPVAVPFALFQWVAPPSTPPPVLVVAPPPAPAQPAQPLPAPVAPAVDARLARIEAALARLAEAHVPADDGPPVARSIEIGVAGTAAPPVPPVMTADGPAALALLQARCVQCHGGGSARGGITLFNAAGAWEPNVGEDEILRSVRGDRMPRTPRKLTAEEKALVQRGLPAVRALAGR